MILIYSNNDSPRLRYICRFIFEEQLGIEFKIIRDAKLFSSEKGYKINYSDETPGGDDAFQIIPHPLLQEKNIREQQTDCGKKNALPVFFRTAGRDLDFDLFAASFYLISRYEEYLPHQKDDYGRFRHSTSLAFREGFLDKPLVNIWILDLADKLRKKFPDIVFKTASFHFLPTYDIDIAYSYNHKGPLRLLGGFLRQPSFRRIAVLCGRGKDPFDIYDELDALHEKLSLHPVYFFLAAEKPGRFDKNNLISSRAMKQLIRRHASKYPIGIHPSWKSHEDPNALALEKAYLEDLCETEIDNSRQHYIRFSLPDTYRHLISRGIRNEYSMGYGSINGFRASAAASFNWYDLEAEKETGLRIHPFCYMDANCYFKEKLSPEKAYEELIYYYNACRAVNGNLITVFHNMFMAKERAFDEWRKNYIRFLHEVIH